MKKLQLSSSIRNKDGVITVSACKIQRDFEKISKDFMRNHPLVSPDDLCHIMIRSVIYASPAEQCRRQNKFKFYPVPSELIKKKAIYLDNADRIEVI